MNHFEDAIYQMAMERQPTEAKPLTLDTLLNGDALSGWEGLNPADQNLVWDAIKGLARQKKITTSFSIKTDTIIVWVRNEEPKIYSDLIEGLKG